MTTTIPSDLLMRLALTRCSSFGEVPTHAISREYQSFNPPLEGELVFARGDYDFSDLCTGEEIFIGSVVEIEPNPLDIKYPHKCHLCPRELHFDELRARNPDIPEGQLKKWWKSKVVQFLCCFCFQKELKGGFY